MTEPAAPILSPTDTDGVLATVLPSLALEQLRQVERLMREAATEHLPANDARQAGLRAAMGRVRGLIQRKEGER